MCQSTFIRDFVTLPPSDPPPPSPPQNVFFTWNKPQLPHMLPKLSLNFSLFGRIFYLQSTLHGSLQPSLCITNTGVISNDINKYDKHLSWSCSQWKPVWFNIKRHILADRRKQESFISDKWGGEEFWKFPLGCNNNWSQIFLLYMWGENTGGLTYLIGHVKTTLLGQEESENALGKLSTPSTHRIHGPTKNIQIEAGGTHPSTGSLACHYQTSACHCHVENRD